jgi:hypothetical protein
VPGERSIRPHPDRLRDALAPGFADAAFLVAPLGGQFVLAPVFGRWSQHQVALPRALLVGAEVVFGSEGEEAIAHARDVVILLPAHSAKAQWEQRQLIFGHELAIHLKRALRSRL